jgi:hypothetical protein
MNFRIFLLYVSICLAWMPNVAAASEIKNAEQLFNLLASFNGKKTPQKPPSTFYVKNISCYVSSEAKDVRCDGVVQKKGKEEAIPLANSKALFDYLKKNKAVFLYQGGLGGVTYKIEQLSCTYSRSGYPYYVCHSKGTVEF